MCSQLCITWPALVHMVSQGFKDIWRLEQQGQVGVDGSRLLCNDEKDITDQSNRSEGPNLLQRIRVRHVEIAFVLLDVIFLG